MVLVFRTWQIIVTTEGKVSRTMHNTGFWQTIWLWPVQSYKQSPGPRLGMYQNVSVEWQQAAGAGPPAATHSHADLLNTLNTSHTPQQLHKYYQILPNMIQTLIDKSTSIILYTHMTHDKLPCWSAWKCRAPPSRLNVTLLGAMDVSCVCHWDKHENVSSTVIDLLWDIISWGTGKSSIKLHDKLLECWLF